MIRFIEYSYPVLKGNMVREEKKEVDDEGEESKKGADGEEEAVYELEF
jgi:hypothetical protein